MLYVKIAEWGAMQKLAPAPATNAIVLTAIDALEALLTAKIW